VFLLIAGELVLDDLKCLFHPKLFYDSLQMHVGGRT